MLETWAGSKHPPVAGREKPKLGTQAFSTTSLALESSCEGKTNLQMLCGSDGYLYAGPVETHVPLCDDCYGLPTRHQESRTCPQNTRQNDVRVATTNKQPPINQAYLSTVFNPGNPKWCLPFSFPGDICPFRVASHLLVLRE